MLAMNFSKKLKTLQVKQNTFAYELGDLWANNHLLGFIFLICKTGIIAILTSERENKD